MIILFFIWGSVKTNMMRITYEINYVQKIHSLNAYLNKQKGVTSWIYIYIYIYIYMGFLYSKNYE